MSSFCTAKATHIFALQKLLHCKRYSHFFSKKFQHICVSLDVNFNESLTNDVVSFEQLCSESLPDYIAPDQVRFFFFFFFNKKLFDFFLISLQKKNMLWVLSMYSQHTFSWKNDENIYLYTSLIWGSAY